MEWTLCKDRLPDREDDYIGTVKWWNGEVESDVCRYSPTTGWREDSKLQTVVAWCEFPEPWEGAEE